MLGTTLEMLKDLFDHQRIFPATAPCVALPPASLQSDAGDDLDVAAAGLAGLDVEVEHALQALGPRHRDVARGRWLVGGLSVTPATPGRGHLLTQPTILPKGHKGANTPW